MERTFKYRMIKGSWGIAVDLTAGFTPYGQFNGKAVEIDNDLWLAVEVKELSQAEYNSLVLGLKLIAGRVKKYSAQSEPVVICVEDIRYNPSDYQPEGLVCAMIGWVAQALKLDAPNIPVHFDRQKNRYEFQFANHGREED